MSATTPSHSLLSFIPDSDFKTFYNAYSKAKPQNSDYIEASAAKDILMRSSLSTQDLYKIWTLVDIGEKGYLLPLEFILALHLAKNAINNSPIPNNLPSSILSELLAKKDSLSSNKASSSSQGPTNSNFIGGFEFTQSSSFSQNSDFTTSSPTSTHAAFPKANHFTPDITHIPPSSHISSAPSVTDIDDLALDFATRFPDINSDTNNIISSPKLNQPPTTFSQTSQSTTSPWVISESQKTSYKNQFHALDSSRLGSLPGSTVRDYFLKFGIPVNELSQIWQLSDSNNSGSLSLNEFSVALHLLNKRKDNIAIPQSLPQELLNFINTPIFQPSPTTQQPKLAQTFSSTSHKLSSSQNDSSTSLKTNKYSDDTHVLRSSRRHLNTQNASSDSILDSSKISDLQAYLSKKQIELETLKQSNFSSKNITSFQNLSENQLIDKIKSVTGNTIDLDHFAFSDYNQTQKISDSSLENLIIKRQQLVTKAFLLYSELQRLFEDYSNKSKSFLSVQTQKFESAKKLSSPNVSDKSSKAASLIAERMKALTGLTYTFENSPSVSSPSTPNPDDISNKIKLNTQSYNQFITEIDSHFHQKGFEGLFSISDLSYLFDFTFFEKFQNGSGIFNTKVSDLILELKNLQKSHISSIDLIPSNILDSLASKPIDHNSPNFNESYRNSSPFVATSGDFDRVSTPVTTLNSVMKSYDINSKNKAFSPASDSSFRSNRTLDLSSEDRAAKLKKLAQQRLIERQKALGLYFEDPSPAQTTPTYANTIDNSTTNEKSNLSNTEASASPFTPSSNGNFDSSQAENHKPQHNTSNSHTSTSTNAILNSDLKPAESSNIPASANPFFSHDENNLQPPTSSNAQTNLSPNTVSDARNSPSNEQFHNTAATLFSKLFGSPQESKKNLESSIEFLADDDNGISSDSSADFFITEPNAAVTKNQPISSPFNNQSPFNTQSPFSAKSPQANTDSFDSIFLNNTKSDSNNTDEIEPMFYQAVFDYNPTEDSGIHLEYKDLIIILPTPSVDSNSPISGKFDSNWIYGEKLILVELADPESYSRMYDGWVKSGIKGWIPKIYVSKLGSMKSSSWTKFAAIYRKVSTAYDARTVEEITVKPAQTVRILPSDGDDDSSDSDSSFNFDSSNQKINYSSPSSGYTKVCLVDPTQLEPNK
ncbi:Actin cytoskeleton-regulatory complex protein PAN1, partial [Smittium culicis]